MGRFITNSRIDPLLRQGAVEEALAEPIKELSADRSGIAYFVADRGGRRNVLTEDAAFAALTLGDFLYDYVRIDPEVLHGIEFARAADVDSMLSFAHFAETKAHLSNASLNGLHSELQGYVAEQIAAHHLMAQGHDVTFPHTPNNPGSDFEVDGHPFQVKCLADPQGVFEHLQKYPNIPVIVNEELASKVGDHSGVYVDPELHRNAVRHVTEETLAQGRELADFEIPWISLAISGAANFYYMWLNETDLTGMLTCTLTDTVGRTLVGTLGKYAGAGAGLILFGPAGAIVIGGAGAIGGASAGRRLSGGFRRALLIDEESRVRRAIWELANAAAEAMPPKQDAWRRKIELFSQRLAGHANRCKVQEIMRRRLTEHLANWTKKETEIRAMVGTSASTDVILTANRLLTLIGRAGIHAYVVREPLARLLQLIKEYMEQSKRFHTITAS